MVETGRSHIILEALTENIRIENGESSVINQLRESTSRVFNFVSAERPDQILVTGWSAPLPHTFFTLECLRRTKRGMHADRISPDLNYLLYKIPLFRYRYGDNVLLPDDSKVPGQFSAALPKLKPEDKLLVLDDFATTGHKARYYKNRLHELGFPHVTFATFVALVEQPHYSVDFVGSEDKQLYLFIRNLAKGYNELGKDNVQIETRRLIKTNLVKQLRDIVRYF